MPPLSGQVPLPSAGTRTLVAQRCELQQAVRSVVERAPHVARFANSDLRCGATSLRTARCSPLMRCSPAWPDLSDASVRETGAWILPDSRQLLPDLEEFLDAGEPPLYFGLGSIPAPNEDITRAMIESARARPPRARVQRWADLTVVDSRTDGLWVDEANQQSTLPTRRGGGSPRRSGHDDRSGDCRCCAGPHSVDVR